MSQKNAQGKRTARERLREQQDREKATDRRTRRWKVAGVIVAVLAVAGGVGAAVANQVGGGGESGAEARPVTVGDTRAPVTLTVYEDFRCPACRGFEEMYRETIHKLERAGKLRTKYHIVTIIDGNMGGRGSAYAANAALCADDQDRFSPYHDVLFSNQPAEQDDRFGNPRRLIELAGEVKGLDNDRFRTCVRKNSHADRVEQVNAAFLESGHNSTPTILLGKKNIFHDPSNPLTPQKLEELVEKRA